MADDGDEAQQRRIGRPGRLGLLAAAVVVLVGLGAALFAWVQEDQRVRSRRGEVTNAAAQDVFQATNQTLTAIAIVDGIVADGTVTPEEFAAYASDVVAGSSFRMLAREVPVTAAERAAFEQRTGVEITDLGAGGFVRAADRPDHLPVVEVQPVDPSAVSVQGFDLLGEPVRAGAVREAERTLEPVFSEPVTLAGSERVGSFVVVPLVVGDREGEHTIIGFVSSAVATEDLAIPARDRLPDGASLTVSDGDTVLTGPEREDDAAVTDLTVGGRTWTVSVAGAASPSRWWPAAALAASLLVAAALVLLSRREARVQRRRDAASERNARLATVARRLSFATGTDAAVAVVHDGMAEVVGADRAEIWWVVDPARLARARIAEGGATDDDAPDDASIARDGDQQVARALRERRTLVEGGSRLSASCPLYGVEGAALGVLSFGWDRPVEDDDLLAPTLETLARLVGQTVRRTRITEDADAVAELAGELAAAATEAELAALVQAHAATLLGASRVAIRRVDPTGRKLVPVAPTGLSSGLDERWGDLDAGPITPSAATYLDGTSTWIETRDELEHRFPAVAGVDEVQRFAAVSALPLLTSDRAVVGAIAVWWDHDRYLDAETRSVVRTVCDLAGQTLERIRLSELTAEQARQSQAIAELGEGLALADTFERAVQDLARNAGHTVGATSSLVAIQVGDELRFTDGGDGRADGERTISHDFPAGAALLSGDLVLVEDRAEHERRFPDAPPPGADRPGALAAVPLRDERGTAFGAIVLLWDRPQRFDPDDAARFRTLGSVAARTLERTRLRQALADAQQQVVVDLQRQLLAPVDTVDRVEVAAIYEPASEEIGMGGDWYDAVALADGSLAMVVGDVVGHGVEAVASMAQLQNLLSGLIRSGTPLAGVLDQVSTMASPGALASAQLLHLDPATGRIAYLNAGHPWALLRLPTGEVVTLDRPGRTLLGLDVTSPPMSEVDAPAGSLVLAYTDGLVERRGELIDDSIGRLAEALATTDPSGPVDRVLQRLLSEFRRPPGSTDSVDDDVAVVLARMV